MVEGKYKLRHRLKSYVLEVVSNELRGVSYNCILLFLLCYHTLQTYRKERCEEEEKRRRDKGEMR